MTILELEKFSTCTCFVGVLPIGKRLGEIMLNDDTTYPCPTCGLPAILMVDPETETIPTADEDENKQYYCLLCSRKFAVDKQGVAGAPSLP